MLLAGLDGCPKGWCAVTFDTQTTFAQATLVKDLFSFLLDAGRPEIVAIDIPIGLTDIYPRPPDVAARHALKGRASCVFPSPLRSALHSGSRLAACQTSRQICGKGVGAQSFAIYSKVREVDELLQAHPELRSRVYEVHPELSFKFWLGAIISARKRSPEGERIRMNLVEETFGPALAQLHPPRGAARDDLLDACAALWTALRIASGAAVAHPKNECLDDTGIRMAIWA